MEKVSLEEDYLSAKENLKDEAATGFHVGHFPKGHRATNFERFFTTSETEECYAIQYEDCFEPYIVARKDSLPRYDERFRGYGLNKVSHLMACSKSFNFVCSSNSYVLSPEMKKSDSWDKMYNKTFKDPLLAVKIQVLFDRFNEEITSRTGKIEKKRQNVQKPQVENLTDGDVAMDFSSFTKKVLIAEEAEQQISNIAQLAELLQGREAWIAKAMLFITGGLMVMNKLKGYSNLDDMLTF